MKRNYFVLAFLLLVGFLLASCSMPSDSNSGSLEGTRVALAIQQTSLALEQTQNAAVIPVEATPEVVVQPTYTPYPTYTAQVVEEVIVEEQPTIDVPAPTEQAVIAEPLLSFEDWLEGANILIYDDMYGEGEPQVVENALDGLGLGRNTKNVRDAMGDFLSNMNSSTEWDLIIVAAESRDSISGEYFDVIADQLDRGSAVIIEIWYIDDIFYGRIQPVMQRCGISLHREWERKTNANLNEYLVYLLEPGDPLFSEPNAISMLIPYDVLWWGDAGDLLELNPGSDAVLMGGTQSKEHSAYGLLAECLDGRMIWQTFSTHDYKTQEMINLWQNYIINTLRARFDSLQ